MEVSSAEVLSSRSSTSAFFRIVRAIVTVADVSACRCRTQSKHHTSLLLSSAQLHATVTDLSLVFLRPLGYAVVDLRRFGSSNDLLIRSGDVAVLDVGKDRIVEQTGLLIQSVSAFPFCRTVICTSC